MYIVVYLGNSGTAVPMRVAVCRKEVLSLPAGGNSSPAVQTLQKQDHYMLGCISSVQPTIPSNLTEIQLYYLIFIMLLFLDIPCHYEANGSLTDLLASALVIAVQPPLLYVDDIESGCFEEAVVARLRGDINHMMFE